MKIYEVNGLYIAASGSITVFDRACNPLAVKDHGFVERAERIRFVPVAEPVTGPMPRIDEGRDDDHFAKAGKMIKPEPEPFATPLRSVPFWPDLKPSKPRPEVEPEETMETLVTAAEAEWAKQNAEKAAAEKLWSERKAAQAKEAKAFKAKPVIKTKPQVTPTTGLSKLEPRPEPKKSNLPALMPMVETAEVGHKPTGMEKGTTLSRFAALHGNEIIDLHQRWLLPEEIANAINSHCPKADRVNPTIISKAILELKRHGLLS